MSPSITGGCACGNLRYSFDGEPVGVVRSPSLLALQQRFHIVNMGADVCFFLPSQATCHCTSCRRSTSSAYSTSLLVPAPAFHLLEGTPKAFTRQGDSGQETSDCFCPNCGALVYVLSKAASGLVIVKAGSLDDLSLNETKFQPRVEIFCKNKYSWLPAIEGAQTFDGALPA